MTYEEWESQLSTDPGIMGGTTTFPETRLTVRSIGGRMHAGDEIKKILEDYPYLTKEDVLFSVRWVQENVKGKEHPCLISTIKS